MKKQRNVKRFLSLMLVIFILFITTACNADNGVFLNDTQNDNHKEDEADIIKVIRQFEAAMNEGDFEKMQACFSRESDMYYQLEVLKQETQNNPLRDFISGLDINIGASIFSSSVNIGDLLNAVDGALGGSEIMVFGIRNISVTVNGNKADANFETFMLGRNGETISQDTVYCTFEKDGDKWLMVEMG
jgi:hypothetical protein